MKQPPGAPRNTPADPAPTEPPSAQDPPEAPGLARPAGPPGSSRPGFTRIETISPDALRRDLGSLVLGAGAAPGDWPEQLSAYLGLLVRWNEQINLVSRKSIDRVVEAQLVPSLAALQLLPADQPIKLLDVGSGGGFPGIPCAILRPRAEIALVDATRKKCLFLEAAIRELGLERVTVHWTRVETPTPALRALAPFDVAVARAVGRTDGLRNGIRTLLRPAGEFWAFAAPDEPGAVKWPSDDSPAAALVRIL